MQLTGWLLAEEALLLVSLNKIAETEPGFDQPSLLQLLLRLQSLLSLKKG
jgi:hypothetical protein